MAFILLTELFSNGLMGVDGWVQRSKSALCAFDLGSTKRTASSASLRVLPGRKDSECRASVRQGSILLMSLLFSAHICKAGRQSPSQQCRARLFLCHLDMVLEWPAQPRGQVKVAPPVRIQVRSSDPSRSLTKTCSLEWSGCCRPP